MATAKRPTSTPEQILRSRLSYAVKPDGTQGQELPQPLPPKPLKDPPERDPLEAKREDDAAMRLSDEMAAELKALIDYTKFNDWLRQGPQTRENDYGAKLDQALLEIPDALNMQPAKRDIELAAYYKIRGWGEIPHRNVVRNHVNKLKARMHL